MNEKLIENIKNWLKTDSEVKHLQQQLKQLKIKRKTLSNNLIEIMKSNNIDAFDINDGKLLYTKNRIRTPLSKKHLKESLTKYFQNALEKRSNLCKLIKDSRLNKIREYIRKK